MVDVISSDGSGLDDNNSFIDNRATAITSSTQHSNTTAAVAAIIMEGQNSESIPTLQIDNALIIGEATANSANSAGVSEDIGADDGYDSNTLVVVPDIAKGSVGVIDDENNNTSTLNKINQQDASTTSSPSTAKPVDGINANHSSNNNINIVNSNSNAELVDEGVVFEDMDAAGSLSE